jgi:hypothetical protein
MLRLWICTLKPTDSRGIEILPSSHKELGFQPKSFNWRPNSEFEGSWSSTKMHAATIHDPHQQIRIQTPQNRRTRKRHENHTSYKREIDTTMKASIHLEVRFFTNGGKSNPMEQGNENQSGRMVFLETLESIYMSPSGPGKRPRYP